MAPPRRAFSCAVTFAIFILFFVSWTSTPTVRVTSAPEYSYSFNEQQQQQHGQEQYGQEQNGQEQNDDQDTTDDAAARPVIMETEAKPAPLVHHEELPPWDEPRTHGAVAENLPQPVVKLQQGSFKGLTMAASAAMRLAHGVEAFLGVPYASSYRFSMPLPLDRSDKVFAANVSGPQCWAVGPVTSVDSGHVGGRQSENCLNADIYRPRGVKAGDGLPVLVTVHGGAFVSGNTSERSLASFVSSSALPSSPGKGVVAVTFNYRLGALGFLSSSVMARQRAVNIGLEDQQRLLDWVRGNIRGFGGDENKVTLLGFSAGAHSVGHHIMSYASGNVPFQKSILESGAATARSVLGATNPLHEVQFRELLAAADISHLPESEIFRSLRSMPIGTLMAASTAVWDKYRGSLRWPFQPVVAGAGSRILPAKPIKGWTAPPDPKTAVRVPTVTGFNTNEASKFIPEGASSGADFRAFFAELLPTFAEHDLDILEMLYPDPDSDGRGEFAAPPASKSLGRQWRRIEAAYTHWAYVCPVLQTAHYVARAGKPVWVWEYAAQADPYGLANHGDHLLVSANDVLRLQGKPGLLAAAQKLHRYYTQFLASADGNPNEGNSADDVEWPAWVSPFGDDAEEDDEIVALKGGKAGRILVLGEGNTERISGLGGGLKGRPVTERTLDTRERERCRFWWDRTELSEDMGEKSKVSEKSHQEAAYAPVD